MSHMASKRRWVRPAVFAVWMLAAFACPRSAMAEPDSEPGARPELWFPVGEELIYRVHWGRIRVGTTRITTDWVDENGTSLIRIRYRTKSNRYLRWIYPVDSVIESYIDPETFQPLRFVNQMHEGRRQHDEETIFDWEAGVARWVSHLSGRSKEFALEPGTRCIPGLMYYMRQTPLEPHSDYTFEGIMADEKLYDVLLKTEDYERVRLPRYGRVRSLRTEPIAEFDGVMVRSGRILLWISDDDRRLATRISAEVPVARVHLTLDRVRGPGDDSWSSGDDGDDDDDDDDDDEDD